MEDQVYCRMELQFAGLIVLHPSYQEVPAFKRMLDENGWLNCSFVDPDGPVYLRVNLTEPYQSRTETEILIPHSAVAMIFVDESVKKIGF